MAEPIQRWSYSFQSSCGKAGKTIATRSASKRLTRPNDFYDGAPPPCALDDAPYGALVGKVGVDGQAFLIGDAQHFQAPAAGDLFLAVNDNLMYYEDNRGGFTIILR